jgi:hypothetical protein
MHVDPTTHEHRSSGKVYSDEGDFDVGGDAIAWNVVISLYGTPHSVPDLFRPVDRPGGGPLDRPVERRHACARGSRFQRQALADGVGRRRRHFEAGCVPWQRFGQARELAHEVQYDEGPQFGPPSPAAALGGRDFPAGICDQVLEAAAQHGREAGVAHDHVGFGRKVHDYYGTAWYWPTSAALAQVAWRAVRRGSTW